MVYPKARRVSCGTRILYKKFEKMETAKACVVPRTLLDYYVEALRMQEQEKMPEVGYSMDRRTGQHLLHYCNDTHVHSLICFVCAQIFTDCSGSRETGTDEKYEGKDMWRCRWYRPLHKQVTEITELNNDMISPSRILHARQ